MWVATHRSYDLCASSLGHPKGLNRVTPAKLIILFVGNIFPQEGNYGPGRPGLGRPRLLWLTEVSQTQLGIPISIFFIVTQPQRGRSWTVYCCSELIFVKVINMFFKPL